jgi:hypothetical protein
VTVPAPDPTTVDRCPNDPVGEGTHWFGDDDLCRYCGQRDWLAPDPTTDDQACVFARSYCETHATYACYVRWLLRRLADQKDGGPIFRGTIGDFTDSSRSSVRWVVVYPAPETTT